ncbi:MAG TPA: ACT domain-containing protein [Candidatus Acidoferrales bacterium]|nr:ACT domain-containing protein [Candidatus Acidoferrales bacterium]
MADTGHLILTAVGPDQIGLVEKISQFIDEYGCNIEDSKMAVFCGEFAVIILITGESGKLVTVANAYHDLEVQTGLTISLKTPSIRQSTDSFLPYMLTASCMDHPGIVHKLSQLLTRHGVNIESMETQTYAAPVSGTPIFRLEAALSIPTKANISSLRAHFSEIQRQENIDIELTATKR